MYVAQTLPVDWDQLIIAAALVLSLSTTTVAALRGPLAAVLRHTRGSDALAQFWTIVASALMVLVPVFLVFTSVGQAVSLPDLVRRAVYMSSFGVVAALLTVGLAVMIGMPDAAAPPPRMVGDAALPAQE